MTTTYSKRDYKLRYVSAFLLLISVLMPVLALAETSPWQGNYVGIFTGAGFGTNQVSTTVGASSDPYFQNTANSSAVSNAGTFNGHPSTVLIGIQIGQDWAYNHMVYGLVMDYSNLPLSSSQSVGNVPYPSTDNEGTYSTSSAMSANWLFTLRGRVGYATTLNNWPSLIYLTTGPALSQITVSNNFSDSGSGLGGVGGSSTSSYELGWATGAGFELLAFNHVSLDIEYLYVQMPSVTTSSTIYNSQGGSGIPVRSLSNPFASNGKLTANLIKLGLNYRF